MAELKLSRIHYLRPTKAAAKHAVIANRSSNRYKPSEGRTNHWYRRNTHEGYGSFQQFKNGHYFHAPLLLCTINYRDRIREVSTVCIVN